MSSYGSLFTPSTPLFSARLGAFMEDRQQRESGNVSDEDDIKIAHKVEDASFRSSMLRNLKSGQAKPHRITAWCPVTGLFAYPAPHLRLSSAQGIASTSAIPASATISPSICLALPPLSNTSDEHTSSTSFILQPPESPGAVLRSSPGHEHIIHLSFSPDGLYLAAFTSFTNDEVQSSSSLQSSSIRFLLYQRGDEINSWICIFDWDASRARANLVQNVTSNSSTRLSGKEILDVRWLEGNGQSQSSSLGEGRKRNHNALLDFSGATTLTAVLESNEVLVVHLPNQALQHQVHVIPLESTSLTTQDISQLGTALSPLPLPPQSVNGIMAGQMLDGTLGSLGMSLGMNGISSTVNPLNPIQDASNHPPLHTNMLDQLNLASTDAGTTVPLAVGAAQENPRRIRLAALGPPTTIQKEHISQQNQNQPALNSIVTEFLVAYQEVYYPSILRQAASAAHATATIAKADGSTTTVGLLPSALAVDNPLTNQTNLVNQNGNQVDLNSVAPQGLQARNQANPLIPAEYQLYNQPSAFESGYGDINMSALDELFDNSDFGDPAGGVGGDANGLGGLSSTLDSINQNFANTFSSAIEANGTPSPSKKDSMINNNASSVQDPGTNRSESPNKSLLQDDNTVGSNSENSPRKSLSGAHGTSNGSGGGDEVLPEFLEGQMDGRGVEKGSEVVLVKIKMEWTEYGILSISATPAAKITAQTAALLEDKPNPPSIVTHLVFVNTASSDYDPSGGSTLLTVSAPLSAETSSSSSSSQASQLQTYYITEQPFLLSDAFMSLEGRKSDPDPSVFMDIMEWVIQPQQRLDSLAWLAEKQGVILDIWQQGSTLQALIVDEGDTTRILTSKWEGSLPDHYPMSVSISPSGALALACALDSSDTSQLVGKPALLALTSSSSSNPMEYIIKSEKQFEESSQTGKMDLQTGNYHVVAQAIVDGLVARRSVRDLVLVAQRFDADARIGLLRESWNIATSLLRGARVEQTRLLWPMLGVQRQLCRGSAVGILDDIMQLAACQRILQDSKIALRTAYQQNQMTDVFEGDAVWPIIGHISWVFELWDRIIKQMTSDAVNEDWSAVSFLIVHPLPRMMQQRLIRLIARFANYMMSLRDGISLQQQSSSLIEAGVSDTELAKTILSDIIHSQRTKTQEWGGMLHGLATKLGAGWTDDSPRAREALLTLRLPPEIEKTAREIAFGIREKLLPLLPANIAAMKANEEGNTRNRSRSNMDIITTVPLALDSSGTGYKICSLCSGKTSLFMTSVMSEWQASKRRTCICGGQWLAV